VATVLTVAFAARPSAQAGRGAQPAPAASQTQGSGSPIFGLPRRTTGNNNTDTTPQIPFWWKVDAVKKELGLTEDKAQKISDIYENRQKLLAPLAADFAREGKVLDKMTSDRTADDGTYAIQVWKVESIRSKLNETRLTMLYRIYRELTPEQYQKLQKISERMSSGNNNEDRGRSQGSATGGGR
jgi:Spy/CpxP family protein refolding chaperone